MTTVLFAHGKESGPTGRKIEALGRIAQEEGYQTLSPDYRDLRDPEARVERLLGIAAGLSGATRDQRVVQVKDQRKQVLSNG